MEDLVPLRLPGCKDRYSAYPCLYLLFLTEELKPRLNFRHHKGNCLSCRLEEFLGRWAGGKICTLTTAACEVPCFDRQQSITSGGVCNLERQAVIIISVSEQTSHPLPRPPRPPLCQRCFPAPFPLSLLFSLFFLHHFSLLFFPHPNLLPPLSTNKITAAAESVNTRGITQT